MKEIRKKLLGAVALGLACHAPASLAAYASSTVDAALTVASGTGYQLFTFELAPTAATAVLGDALASADGDVLPVTVGGALRGVLVTGAATADAQYPPASAASASYGNSQPLFLLNIVNIGGLANTLAFDFDWSYVVDALDDFVAPSETASASATLSLRQQTAGTNVTTTLFSESVATTIATGQASDAGTYSFTYTFAPGEVFTSYLVSVTASAQATTVPLPASILLLAPALGLLALRRRADA